MMRPNERRLLELMALFPRAVDCGGGAGPGFEHELIDRLLYAEILSAALVADFGEGHKHSILNALCGVLPADADEAVRLYPDDEIEAERFMWRRFTENRRAHGIRSPEPSVRPGADHAKERRRRAQAKQARRANRRR